MLFVSRLLVVVLCVSVVEYMWKAIVVREWMLLTGLTLLGATLTTIYDILVVKK